MNEYLALRKELHQARVTTLAELRLIEQTLALTDAKAAPKVSPGPSPGPAQSKRKKSVKRGSIAKNGNGAVSKKRGANSAVMTLRQAVDQVLGQQPMNKKEILAAVQKLGYRSKSADPLNPLSVFLYRNYPRTKEGLFIRSKSESRMPQSAMAKK